MKFQERYNNYLMHYGITMCVPDAPYNPKFKEIFTTLKERLI